MIALVYRPAPPLDAFVENVWYYHQPNYSPGHFFERLLPQGSVELVFDLRREPMRIYDRERLDRFETIAGAAIMGAHNEPFVLDIEEQTDVLGVHFKPGGAFPFFGLPLDELQNRHVPLDLLWGSAAGEVRERVLAASDPREKVRLVERALLARFRRGGANLRGGHPAVEFALSRLGERSVASVVDAVGLSARRFAELFRREVGLTPKIYSRVRRFQRVVARLRRVHGDEVDWADLAVTEGYFDQSHLHHDFREFSGITPAAYCKAKTAHSNHVPIV